MSSFTPEQVGHFRQVFTQFSDDDVGGLTQVNFVPAVEASLVGVPFAGPRPSHGYLDGEFQRIAAGEGFIQWQQFFQVLIHLNLRVSPSPAPEVPAHRSAHDEPRVQFTADVLQDDEIAPPSYDQVLEQGSHQVQPFQPFPAPTDRGNSLGRTLLQTVGGYFGLTEASQRGNDDVIGWQEFTERNIEDNTGLFNTLSRRSSLRHRVNPPQQRPPSYPAIATGHSFDMAELGDDSDEETGLTAAPPPMYLDAIGPTGVGEPVVVVRAQEYPEATRPAQPAPATRPQDLIYDKREAWEYYQKYVKTERRLRQRRHQTDAYEFFGSAEGEPVGRARSGSVRRERLNSQEGVVRRPKRNKRTKLQRQSTFIRTEVESLPTFWPVFIVSITIIQFVGLIVLLPLYNLAPIKLTPVERTESFPSLNATNASDPNITYFRSNNLWIGLTPLNLIRFGAKFSPCMRKDFGILQNVNARITDVTTDAGYGCCQNQDRIGNSLITGCLVLTAPNTSETFFEPGIRCSSPNSSTVGPNFHPCCTSITGRCEIMDFDQCDARGGIFHQEAGSCDEVNCFIDICGFNGALIGEGSDSNGMSDPLDPNPQQFWRFFTATYLHLGIVHIIIILPIQLYVGIKIERTIGWLRIGLVYTISGVGGNLVSGIFVPYGVTAGASGAVFGLLAVLFVELFQFWQIVDRAWLEVIKLTAFVVFLLALGTLPYVDNWAHIGGLLFGLPSAIIFVPYITFGTWDAARKRILLVICVPLLFAMLLIGFLTFYLIPTPDFCSFCNYINCIPYSSGLCPDEFDNPNSPRLPL